MTPRDSAYVTLGLRPGASRAQLDEAYRRLIKLHHPDRPGGDSSRAADVNRAYTYLRGERPARGRQQRPVPVVLHPAPRRPRRPANWLFTGLLLAIVAGSLAAIQLGERGNVLARPLEIGWPPSDVTFAPRPPDRLITFDEPLSLPLIDSAIDQAATFHASGDLLNAEMYSRDCQARLRRKLNVIWFDVCSAFDEATLALGGDGQMGRSAMFNESAVVSREMAAARALSDDLIGADSRLHQIRSRVDVQLLPVLDPAAGQNPS